MTSRQERFWMIYGMGQRPPTIRHESFESARSEAQRLARMVPGVRFFILETVAAAEKVDVQFTDFRDFDEIPI
ncbi:MAG TPA: hypothetical protein VFT89_07465 [Rhizobiaceae bacterium]|nr:hypothetical protein [Rhizobiaceae bacterium]